MPHAIEPAQQRATHMLSPAATLAAPASEGSSAGGRGAKRKRTPAAKPKPKPKRRMWTSAEESALETGVCKHGEGKWKKIQCVVTTRHGQSRADRAPAAVPPAPPSSSRTLPEHLLLPAAAHSQKRRLT